MNEKRKAMTVRLPEGLYRAGVSAARRRRVSMSRLLQESLREEEQAHLSEAFGRLGEGEEREVEFAARAQGEVACGGES
jgi:hypothetical protein